LLLPLLLVIGAPLESAAAEEQGDRGEAVSRRMGDDLFAAGGRVRVTDDSAGDALVAGGDLDLRGHVGGDVVVTGGEVALRNDIAGNLYAAGGRLEMQARVAGNARVAGGTVEFGPEADVAGGMSIAGGEVEVEGRIGRYLQIAAGQARIDGFVGGDVEATGGELELGPNAVVEGAVIFRGPRAPEVAPGAQVRDGVRHLEARGFDGDKVGSGLRAAFGFGAILWLLGWAIVGIIAIGLWPGATGAITATASARPGYSLLAGFLTLVAVPVAILILLVTLIGIPLGLMLLALYLTLLPLGYLAAAAAIGEWLWRRIRGGSGLDKRQRMLALAGALVLLLLLGLIPFVGQLLVLLVLLAGIGSLILTGIGHGRGAAAEKVV
jgi:cytoskeletal protein CcmA (bactofilin family)